MLVNELDRLFQNIDMEESVFALMAIGNDFTMAYVQGPSQIRSGLL